MEALDARPLHAVREVKLTSVGLKHVTFDGIFEGYASLFHREDLGRDVIVPGAFRDSLAKRGAAGIRMLFQHDPNQPIGTWIKIHEDRADCSCAAGSRPRLPKRARCFR